MFISTLPAREEHPVIIVVDYFHVIRFILAFVAVPSLDCQLDHFLSWLSNLSPKKARVWALTTHTIPKKANGNIMWIPIQRSMSKITSPIRIIASINWGMNSHDISAIVEISAIMNPSGSAASWFVIIGLYRLSRLSPTFDTDWREVEVLRGRATP